MSCIIILILLKLILFYQVTIMFVDLDQFKEINDNFGHQAGDEVLQKISSIFKNNIRNVDRCGRWGGEEFLIVCPIYR